MPTQDQEFQVIDNPNNLRSKDALIAFGVVAVTAALSAGSLYAISKTSGSPNEKTPAPIESTGGHEGQAVTPQIHLDSAVAVYRVNNGQIHNK